MTSFEQHTSSSATGPPRSLPPRPGSGYSSRGMAKVTDLAPRDVKPPLSVFQAVTSALDKEQNWKMVRSLYDALPEGERRQSETELSAAFDLVWPKLHAALRDVGPGPPGPPSRRSDHEVLDEILGLVRGLVAKARRQESAQAYLSGLKYGLEPTKGGDQGREGRVAGRMEPGTGQSG
jgi:hypothetical protein